MSTPYSATQQFTSADPTVPADGDAASASSVATPFGVGFDRLAYLRGATDGLLVWGHKARVATGGTNNGNFGVYCPPIEAVSLLDGTTWKFFTLASETQLTSALHYSSSTLDADKTYYVYAKVTSSAIALEVSADAPEAGLIWKSGAVGTHRYLFCFHTSSAGVPLPMQMSRGRYLYRFSAVATTELRALTNNAAVAATDVILARAGTAGRELVPAHARIVHLISEVTGSGNHAGDVVAAFYGMNGDLGTNYAFIHRVYAATSSVTNQAAFSCECDSARTIDYAITLGNTDASDPTCVVNLYVVGFDE